MLRVWLFFVKWELFNVGHPQNRVMLFLRGKSQVFNTRFEYLTLSFSENWALWQKSFPTKWLKNNWFVTKQQPSNSESINIALSCCLSGSVGSKVTRWSDRCGSYKTKRLHCTCSRSYTIPSNRWRTMLVMFMSLQFERIARKYREIYRRKGDIDELLFLTNDAHLQTTSSTAENNGWGKHTY